jgi:GNAT superfamily N-acetyltransferase
MPNYTMRRATIEDVDTLVLHRIRMFEDMGVMSMPGANADRLEAAFRSWVLELLPAGTYAAWVVEAASAQGPAEIVAGGGATLIPWPPGPWYPGHRLAFVYNVYTDPAHRGRGLARRVMDAIHEFCRAEGIGSLALNASASGQPLYESLGYRVTQSPMMFLSLT